MFGHAKGAFTGATHTTEGLIREAHGGTLFLDEISEIAPALQVKLLRVLQEREVRPVGGKQVYQVDVRVIAASNKDLKQAMQAGQFREDLYYRLNVIGISVPPLRERADDVQLLAQHFIDRHSRRMGKRIRVMGKDLAEFLGNYSWPGNVRELDNLIERAVILADSETLTSKDLADMLPAAARQPHSPRAKTGRCRSKTTCAKWLSATRTATTRSSSPTCSASAARRCGCAAASGACNGRRGRKTG